MNKPFFVSALGRWARPAVLALAAFLGTIGLASTASAQQGFHGGGRAPVVHVGRAHGAVLRGPRVIVEPSIVAPAYPYGAPIWYGRYGHGWIRRTHGHGWGGLGWGGHGGFHGGHGGGHGGHGR
jgi:hypothetical protein